MSLSRRNRKNGGQLDRSACQINRLPLDHLYSMPLTPMSDRYPYHRLNQTGKKCLRNFNSILDFGCTYIDYNWGTNSGFVVFPTLITFHSWPGRIGIIKCAVQNFTPVDIITAALAVSIIPIFLKIFEDKLSKIGLVKWDSVWLIRICLHFHSETQITSECWKNSPHFPGFCS